MKISIIVPIYNVEEYLEECLQSVAAQTQTDGLECILVDDCGRDNSVAIAQRFIAEYAGPIRFTLIHHERNGGLSAARNTGIKAATGEYVYFLDSDDTIVPECIELMYGLVEKYGKVDMVQGMFIEEDEHLARERVYPLPEYTEDAKVIVDFLLTYRGDIVPAQTKMVRRDFVLDHELFFLPGIIHEDNLWTFQLSKHVRSLAFSDSRTYFHRYNPTSITHAVNVKREAHAYATLIVYFCDHMDSFLRGRQKELLFNTFLTCWNNGYYMSEANRDSLMKKVLTCNTFFQRQLIKMYLRSGNTFFGRYSQKLLFKLYSWESLLEL